MSTKNEHYRHHKSALYGRAVVDCIRLQGAPNQVDTECKSIHQSAQINHLCASLNIALQ